MNIEPPSPEFIRAFKARAGGGRLRFDAFVDLALYDAEVGYYRQPRRRVGYGQGTDFYTASSSGPVFGELVAAACVKLLQAGGKDASSAPDARRPAPDRFTFVEIGAETPGGILEGVAHPFGSARTVQVGGALDLSGPLVVFSNELFDAQPFRRFRFECGHWRELAVELRDGALAEVPLTDDATSLAPDVAIASLPPIAAEGYTIDAPTAAANLAAIIGRQPWTGLFVAFDYGKTWRELIEACPAGTARAYFRHTQSNDLLARPGQQDLTCHVCWDWLVDTLGGHGFANVRVDSQESFFVHQADAYLQKAIADDAGRLTARKRSLLQLLHGSHLGQKFQVLSALRMTP